MTKEEILQLAKTTNDTSTIQMILDFSNNELLLTLFDNPNLTKDNRKYIIDNADFTTYDISSILEELAESKLNSNKLLVVNHKFCTLEILNKISNNTNDEIILLSIIQNKLCSTNIAIDIIKKSYKLCQPIFDVLLEHDLNEEQILDILQITNYSTASCLFALSHKNCTSNILETISEQQSCNEKICIEVINHKLVTVNALLNYINDTYWVKNPTNAWNKLNERFPDVITAEFIDNLLLNDDIRIKEKILAHKNCSLDTIIKVSMRRPVSYMHEDELIEGLKNRNLTTQQLMRLVQETDICETYKGDFILDSDNCTSEIFEVFIQKNLDDEHRLACIIKNHKNFPIELIPKITINKEMYEIVKERFKDTVDVDALLNYRYFKDDDVNKIIKNTNSIDELMYLFLSTGSGLALKKLAKMSLTEKDFDKLLSQCGDYELDHVLDMILNHKNCTATTICTVLDNYSDIDSTHNAIIVDKLKTLDLTVDQIKQLYELSNYKIKEYLLSLPNCPLDFLLDIVINHNINYANNIIELLKNRELTEEHIIQLSKCKYWSVRAFAASHALCPITILNELAEDEDSTVQSSVASNPNCPVQTLLKIATKIKEVISSDRIDSEILTNIYNICDESYYNYIAKNPNCPEDIRKQIEAKNIKFNNILFIRTESGLNADGFDVEIYENNDNEPEPTKVFRTSYRYGYNASYDKSWANEQKPFTSDILVELVNKYNIDKITIGAGTYVFSGESMTEDDCKDFVKKYIQPNNILSKLFDA